MAVLAALLARQAVSNAGEMKQMQAKQSEELMPT
jgi:hypothetical protein